ncbi:hypothetical protein GCM10010124_00980 [Pilimelia terevasa]|uniref:Uncharacterized protein n=1 Tax=Pilimelia terevasa TaxID=53372 RepID=A0A8J3BGD5_9ACTN|nr:hypothetical protein GCM10010124_00980 [Pilimelia terevasa]
MMTGTSAVTVPAPRGAAAGERTASRATVARAATDPEPQDPAARDRAGADLPGAHPGGAGGGAGVRCMAVSSPEVWGELRSSIDVGQPAAGLAGCRWAGARSEAGHT